MQTLRSAVSSFFECAAESGVFRQDRVYERLQKDKYCREFLTDPQISAIVESARQPPTQANEDK